MVELNIQKINNVWFKIGALAAMFKIVRVAVPSKFKNLKVVRKQY
jgi:hypothetical protein